MKIKCDLSKNYLAIYNEILNVARHRKQIIKKGRANKLNFLPHLLLNFFFWFILATIIYFLTKPCGSCSTLFFSLIMFFDLIYLVLELIRFTAIRYYRHTKCFKGECILDEDGLTNDSYYDIKITFKWSKIKAVVIKKYSVTILTDTPFYFYFDIDCKDNILKCVKKYSKDTLIIK